MIIKCFLGVPARLRLCSISKQKGVGPDGCVPGRTHLVPAAEATSAAAFLHGESPLPHTNEDLSKHREKVLFLPQRSRASTPHKQSTHFCSSLCKKTLFSFTCVGHKSLWAQSWWDDHIAALFTESPLPGVLKGEIHCESNHSPFVPGHQGLLEGKIARKNNSTQTEWTGN